MSYERLTSRNDFQGQCSHCKYIPALDEYGCWNDTEKRFMLCNKCENKERYDRLKELEDKIENGTFVELPFKIGTLVYVIYTNRETEELDVRITDVVGYEIMRGELWVKTSIPYRKCYIEIENVFRTQAEAEEKLRELRGEK